MKKLSRIVLGVLIVCLFVGVVSAFDQPSQDGDETYLIATVSELQWFSEHVNDGYAVANATLTADIDMTDVWNSWIPIAASSANAYSGIFDGNGHIVSYLSKPLFGYSAGGIIKNVYLEDANIISENTLPTGSLLAICGEGVQVLNCHANICSVESYMVGGCLIGEIDGGVISQCSVSHGYVTGLSNMMNAIGGLVGMSSDSTLMYNCNVNECMIEGLSTSSVKERNLYGGLVGHCLYGPNDISFCYAHNVKFITKTSSFCQGGIVGLAGSGQHRINQCAYNYFSSIIPPCGKGTGTISITNTYGVNTGVSSEETIFHTQGFWDGTGVSGRTYLSWDFTTPIWYWDFDNELPTLQPTILRISNLVPLSGSLEFGNPFTCTVTATSPNPITYQWYQSTNGVSFTPMSGQTTNVMTYTAPAKGDYYFKVIVADGVDTIDSLTDFGAVTLEVYGMKIWSIVPLSSTLKVGENFNVTANVTSPYTISYQWYESTDNSTYAPMSDQTSANLNFTVMVKGYYYYKLIVNDGVDTIDSLSKFPPVSLIVYGISNNTIENVGDFTEWKNNYTQYLTSNLILGNDIDMSGFTDGIPQFNGGFNGQSYALTALTVPLIQSLGGNIYNLSVKDSLINMGGNVGLIASSVTQGSTLTNVFGENSFVKSTNSNAGSLVGAITGTDVSIQNCGATSCTVVGSTSAGGIAGTTQSDTDIVNAQVSKCDILATNGKAYGVAP